MSNYRRLISYIYAYEGGIKGKNIGFAKIETRGIQCKITVSVKRIYVGGNDIGVYLLSGEQELYLGNIFIRGGSGEFRATVSANDVEHSGVNMDQCFGLTIHDVKNSWRSYTTIWEDAVAHAAEVDLDQSNSTGKEDSAISEEQIKKAVQEIEEEFPLKESNEESSKEPLKEETSTGVNGELPASDESSQEGEEEDTAETDALNAAEKIVEQVKADESLPEIQQLTGSVPDDDSYKGPTITGPTAGWKQGNPPPITSPVPDWQQNTRPVMTGPIPGWWQEPMPTGPASTGPMPAVSIPTVSLPADPTPAVSTPTVSMPTGSMPTGSIPTESMSVETVTKGEAETEKTSQQEALPIMEKPVIAGSQQEDLKESVQMSSNAASLAEKETDPVFSEPNVGTTRLYRADAAIKEAKDQKQTEPKLGNPEVLERLRQNENSEETSHSAVWDKLSREHTRILAFDYEDGCEILTIKPQDIGVLPRDAWVYGNNSFLLHGYYNYRYLILAKLLNPEGTPRYLLGIPGHYYSNERYMASMFGFPNFVLSKEQPMEDGRFGFWYTDIKLGG